MLRITERHTWRIIRRIGQGCCSLMHSRLFSLSPPLIRVRMKQLSINHIQAAGFCSYRDSEGAKLSSSLSDSSNDSPSVSFSDSQHRYIINAAENAVLGAVASISTPPSQSQLRADIDGIFRDRNLCNEMLFNKFIIEDLQDCNISNIARFMRLAGKKSKSKSNDYLRGHLICFLISCRQGA